MELLPIVCAITNTPTGVVLPRHEAIKQQAWCRSTNVFVMNSKGELLVHQRSLQKERFPGAWSTHLGGHVGVDETYESNAVKELFEEAGIMNPSFMVPWRTTKLTESRLWVREFLVHGDFDLKDLVPQPGEVESFAWMSVEAIMEASENDPGNWLAGTHDLQVEYECMRAVVNAFESTGHIPFAGTK